MEFLVLPGLSDQAVRQSLLAALIVAASFLLARVIAGRLGPAIAARWLPADPVSGDTAGSLVRSVLRWLLALAFLVAASALELDAAVARLVLALGAAGAASGLAYRVARSAGAGAVTGALLGAIAGVGTLAGMLRGLEPILEGLNAASLSVGSRRITLLGVLNAVLIIGLLFTGTRLAIRLIGRSIDRARGLDHYQRVLTQKLVAVAFVILASLIGIDLLGIDLTALAVFSGAFGLAVGFGLQKTFGNLLSGLILLMDRSVKPGDVIVVGDTFGWVNKIGVRAVSVITRDGKEHLIPNELLMTERVENWSYSSRDVRVRITLGVAYDSDLTLAERLMVEAATATARVLDHPAPNVWLRDFGERWVEYDILVWIRDPEQGVGNIRSEILSRIWRLFKEHGIEIPPPRREIQIRPWPDRDSPQA